MLASASSFFNDDSFQFLRLLTIDRRKKLLDWEWTVDLTFILLNPKLRRGDILYGMVELSGSQFLKSGTIQFVVETRETQKIRVYPEDSQVSTILKEYSQKVELHEKIWNEVFKLQNQRQNLDFEHHYRQIDKSKPSFEKKQKSPEMKNILRLKQIHLRGKYGNQDNEMKKTEFPTSKRMVSWMSPL